MWSRTSSCLQSTCFPYRLPALRLINDCPCAALKSKNLQANISLLLCARRRRLVDAPRLCLSLPLASKEWSFAVEGKRSTGKWSCRQTGAAGVLISRGSCSQFNRDGELHELPHLSLFCEHQILVPLPLTSRHGVPAIPNNHPRCTPEENGVPTMYRIHMRMLTKDIGMKETMLGKLLGRHSEACARMHLSPKCEHRQ